MDWFIYVSVAVTIVGLVGYFGRWRWLGIMYVPYAVVSIMGSESALWAVAFLLLPPFAYYIGMLIHRWRKGTWPTDKVSEEMAAGFLSGEDADGLYVVWENEVEVMRVRTLVILSAVFAGAVYLANYPFDDTEIFKTLGVIAAVLSGATLFAVLLLMNRIRYRYGCYDGGYGFAITDSRYLGSSSASIVAGVADGDLTLAGAGFLAKGGLGGMRREWSTAEWCDWDDAKMIVRVHHGCCKTDKLCCVKRSYPIVKALASKHIGVHKNGKQK